MEPFVKAPEGSQCALMNEKNGHVRINIKIPPYVEGACPGRDWILLVFDGLFFECCVVFKEDPFLNGSSSYSFLLDRTWRYCWGKTMVGQPTVVSATRDWLCWWRRTILFFECTKNTFIESRNKQVSRLIRLGISIQERTTSTSFLIPMLCRCKEMLGNHKLNLQLFQVFQY